MQINEEKYIPCGIVEIEDIDTGEIVYKTHNMIVEQGRKKILDQMFPENGTSNSYTSCFKFFETNHRDLTVPNMTIVQSGSVTDASTQCNITDMTIDGTDGNLSEIVLDSKSYEIENEDGRVLCKRTTNGNTATDTVIGNTTGTHYPVLTGANPDSPLADNEQLVIKFTDNQDNTNGRINYVFHICCSKQDENNPKKAITAIGLAFKDGDVWKLFSRAAIDPVFMRPGRRYVMHYTLHF